MALPTGILTLQQASRAFFEGKEVDWRPAEGGTAWIKDPFGMVGGSFTQVIGGALEEGAEFRLRPPPLARVSALAETYGWGDAAVREPAELLARAAVRAALRDVREHLQTFKFTSGFVDVIEKDFCGVVIR